MSGVRFTLPAPALWSEMTFLRSVISLQSYAWTMIPPVAPEGMLFRTPAASPDQVRARRFWDHARTAFVARWRVDRSHQGAPVLSAPLAQRQRQCAQNASSRSSNLRWRTTFARIAQRQRRRLQTPLSGSSARRARHSRPAQRFHAPVAKRPKASVLQTDIVAGSNPAGSTSFVRRHSVVRITRATAPKPESLRTGASIWSTYASPVLPARGRQGWR